MVRPMAWVGTGMSHESYGNMKHILKSCIRSSAKRLTGTVLVDRSWSGEP